MVSLFNRIKYLIERFLLMDEFLVEIEKRKDEFYRGVVQCRGATRRNSQRADRAASKWGQTGSQWSDPFGHQYGPGNGPAGR